MDQGRAKVGPQQAGGHGQCGGLARTVGTDHPVEGSPQAPPGSRRRRRSSHRIVWPGHGMDRGSRRRDPGSRGRRQPAWQGASPGDLVAAAGEAGGGGSPVAARTWPWVHGVGSVMRPSLTLPAEPGGPRSRGGERPAGTAETPGISWPSSYAALSHQCGSRSAARAMKTASALPLATMSSACVALVEQTHRAGGSPACVLPAGRTLPGSRHRPDLLMRHGAAAGDVHEVDAATGSSAGQAHRRLDVNAAVGPVRRGDPQTAAAWSPE